MGGNALKYIGVSRITRTQFDSASDTIVRTLSEFCSKIEVVKSYTEKESFGDIDILYVPNIPTEHLKNKIKSLLGATEFYNNGSVFGFGYVIDVDTIVQVDMIKSSYDTFDYNLNYLNWNDLGNLIGRIAHKFGLKHGHDGLVYVIRDSDRIVGKVTLTTDYNDALNFLGFSRLPEEFKTIDSIFEYVVSSKYFNPSIYLLENRNHIARVRDAKRPTYMKFLKHISGMAGGYEFELDKSKYMSKILGYFSGCVDEYNRLIELKNLINSCKRKFNGDIVASVTNLEGPELGKFIRYLKSIAPFNSLELIDSMANDDVIEKINEIFVDFRSGGE